MRRAAACSWLRGPASSAVSFTICCTTPRHGTRQIKKTAQQTVREAVLEGEGRSCPGCAAATSSPPSSLTIPPHHPPLPLPLRTLLRSTGTRQDTRAASWWMSRPPKVPSNMSCVVSSSSAAAAAAGRRGRRCQQPPLPMPSPLSPPLQARPLLNRQPTHPTPQPTHPRYRSRMPPAP